MKKNDDLCVYALVMLLSSTPALMLDSSSKEGLSVLGGSADVTSKYPFVVSLKNNSSRVCSGSLITSTWVLSAAHCCSERVNFIQWGDMKIPLNKTESKSEVIKKVPHPQYVKPTRSSNDIGLILVRQVMINKYGKVSAIDYKTLLGHQVEFAGYGSTFIPTRETHHKRLKRKLDRRRPLQIGGGVVKKCEALRKKWFICVAPKCSHKELTLSGDSGGPLFYDNKIVGVVHGHLSRKNGYDKTDRMFAPVSPQLSWIRSVVTSNHKPMGRILTFDTEYNVKY